jgi:hypothetical protein
MGEEQKQDPKEYPVRFVPPPDSTISPEMRAKADEVLNRLRSG